MCELCGEPEDPGFVVQLIGSGGVQRVAVCEDCFQGIKETLQWIRELPETSAELKP